MNVQMRNGKIVINGREFFGSNISISNNNIIVDGVTQTEQLTGSIDVIIHGDVNSLQNQSGNVTANNVGDIITVSGDVTCGNISGSIRTVSGDVQCGSVGGNIKTGSGDVCHR